MKGDLGVGEHVGAQHAAPMKLWQVSKDGALQLPPSESRKPEEERRSRKRLGTRLRKRLGKGLGKGLRIS